MDKLKQILAFVWGRITRKWSKDELYSMHYVIGMFPPVIIDVLGLLVFLAIGVGMASYLFG